jgi:hypothetical protein
MYCMYVRIVCISMYVYVCVHVCMRAHTHALRVLTRLRLEHARRYIYIYVCDTYVSVSMYAHLWHLPAL